MKHTVILSAVLLLLGVGAAHSSALSMLAAGMRAGEWKELPAPSLSGELLFLNCNGDYWYADMAATWTNYLTWNPATKEIHWTGAPHMAPFQFLKYLETSNTWTSETNVAACMRLPVYEGCFNHGYDLGTIDQEKGIYYYKSTSSFFSYVISTKTWSQWSVSQFSSDRADAMAFFPPLNKLCHIIGGTVRLVDPTTHAVENVASGLSMGGYNNTAEFSSMHRKVYFGGGSNTFYSMDSAKRVTRLADAPESYSCTNSSLACDAVTGNPLILANSNNYYVYSATSSQWTKITSPPAELNHTSAAIAAMATGIPEYGVVFYMSPKLKKVYLYKHAVSGTAAGKSALSASLSMSVSPNPVVSSTRISLGAAYGKATLSVYNCKGQGMASVESSKRGVFYWDASGVPAGQYLAKMESNGRAAAKWITVVK